MHKHMSTRNRLKTYMNIFKTTQMHAIKAACNKHHAWSIILCAPAAAYI